MQIIETIRNSMQQKAHVSDVKITPKTSDVSQSAS